MARDATFRQKFPPRFQQFRWKTLCTSEPGRAAAASLRGCKPMRAGEAAAALDSARCANPLARWKTATRFPGAAERQVNLAARRRAPDRSREPSTPALDAVDGGQVSSGPHEDRQAPSLRDPRRPRRPRRRPGHRCGGRADPSLDDLRARRRRQLSARLRLLAQPQPEPQRPRGGARRARRRRRRAPRSARGWPR